MWAGAAAPCEWHASCAGCCALFLVYWCANITYNNCILGEGGKAQPSKQPAGWSGLPASSDQSVRGSREHTFQIGNDRLVLVANNYGAVRVRSDEGSPKYFVSAETGVKDATQLGGGFGYLFPQSSSSSNAAVNQSRMVATSYYTGGASDRDFGIGWVATSGTSTAVSVNHTVATPFGDDPVVLIEVVVENHGNALAHWSWSEVWGSAMEHLDPSWARLPTTSAANFTQSHYKDSWAAIQPEVTGAGSVTGAAHARQWLGLTHEEESHFNSIYKYPVPPGAGMWDEKPATPYLAHVASVGAAAGTTTMSNDAAAFFGPGGVANPAGTLKWKPTSATSPALIASTSVQVPAKGRAKLHYIWGYAEHGKDVAAVAATMVAKHRATLEDESGLAAAVEKGWSPHLARFKIPPRVDAPAASEDVATTASTDWVAGETAWHSYYLQAATTYDSYMGEHMVDQGTMYRYSSGFQGAARDPVQHALPLIELRPELAKSVLRYTLSEMYTNFTNNQPAEPGLLPYALYGRAIIADGSFNPLLSAGLRSGGIDGVGSATNTVATASSAVGALIGGTAIRPDDMELYVLLCASEYLLATKDVAFLNETVTFFGKQGSQTVMEALHRAVHFVVDVVGVGPHGLMRELTSDWDDGIAVRPDFPRDFNKSESVLTASLATHVMDRVAAAFRMVSDDATADKAEQFAAGNRNAILEHAFNGKWLRRAWFGNQTGWIGDTGASAAHGKGMFSAQHGWAMLGDVFASDASALNATLTSLAAHCREGWAYGYAYICDPATPPPAQQLQGTPSRSGGSVVGGRDGGSVTQYPNAPGMWPAVDHPIILGLLAANRTQLAWEEYVRNSLHWETAVSPDYWVGIWTSADSVNGDGSPSEWTGDFPGLCTHRHAWPLVTARHLAGVTYTADGVRIRPGLPTALGAYSWSTPLASVAWDGNATWTGHYNPGVAGRWTVDVDLSLLGANSGGIDSNIKRWQNQTIELAVRGVGSAERSGSKDGTACANRMVRVGGAAAQLAAPCAATSVAFEFTLAPPTYAY